MKAIVAAVRRLFSGRGQRQEPPALSPSGFAEEVARQLRVRLPDVRTEIAGPLELALTSPTGSTQRVFLDNAYRAWRSEDGEGRARVIESYLASYVEAQSGLARSRDAIVPTVKDREWLEEMRAMRAQGGNVGDIVHEALNEALIVAYAIDTPSNIAYLNEDELAGLDVERSALRALAVRNLRHLLPRIEVHRGERLGMVVADGNYEASLLLFDDLWARESERFRGDPVVAVPARDVLVFADSADAGAVAELAALARQIHQEAGYALSDRVFRVQRDGIALHAE